MLSVFELHSTIFAAFHDIMRAFETVWHAGLINKLKPIGIKGSLLLIIDQCYTDMKSAVFVNEATSTWFPVTVAERQHGVLATFLCKLFIDD
jgi:hypothetical protein